MINVIDSKPKPPKFIYEKLKKDSPDKNASQLERDRFVDRELNRWVTGYGGLTGRHYMYLTQGSIREATGSIIKPFWRSVDEMVFQEYGICVTIGEDLMIVKRREFGLTSIFAGLEPIYNAIVNKGSTSLITSADAKRLQISFSEKVMVMYTGLEDDFRPAHLRERMQGFLHLGIKDKATGKVTGVDSKVYCIETASSDDNAKAFEAYRSNYIFLDEIFLHPRAGQVRSSAQATLSKGFSKMGPIVLGGSCGSETAKEADALKKGAALGQQLWSDAANLDLKTVFISGAEGISNADELDDSGRKTGRKLNFCVNGYSDIKSATEWIMRKRDKLEKAQDKEPYWNFIKQYPLTIEEVFEINRAAFFPLDVYQNLNQAKRDCHAQDTPVGRFDLERQGDLIVRRPNLKGSFFIISEPKPDETYIGGIDPVPYGDASEKEGSDSGLVIKGLMTQEYVAWMSERDLDPDISIGKHIMLQEYFKSKRFPFGALTNVEKNRGEVLLKVYADKGKAHLLSNTPTHLGIEYVDKKIKKGWFNNQHTLIRGNHYIMEFLKKHAIRLRILPLIEQLLKFPIGNSDLLDAMRSCEILDAELTEIDKVKYIPQTTRRVSYFTRDESGRTVVKWRDISNSGF